MYLSVLFKCIGIGGNFMKKILCIFSLFLNLLVIPSQSASYKLNLMGNKVPGGVTLQDAKQALYEETMHFNEPIKTGLIMSAGKPQKLYGRDIAIDIEHIINIRPEIGSDRTVTLQGGHMYKVLAAFKSQGFLHNSVVTKDPNTKCCAFEGYDTITGNQFYKTTFPQGWKPEDIYKAISDSSPISEEKVDDKLIIRAKVADSKKSEFTIRTVSYRRAQSKVYEMLTAFPEL